MIPNKFKKYCVNENDTILDAIKMIQLNKSRTVIIVNRSIKILGIYSEGDILRNQLQGINPHTPLIKVCNKNFKFLNEYSFDQALKIFKKEGISLLPIANTNFTLVGIITINDILSHFEK